MTGPELQDGASRVRSPRAARLLADTSSSRRGNLSHCVVGEFLVIFPRRDLAAILGVALTPREKEGDRSGESTMNSEHAGVWDINFKGGPVGPRHIINCSSLESRETSVPLISGVAKINIQGKDHLPLAYLCTASYDLEEIYLRLRVGRLGNYLKVGWRGILRTSSLDSNPGIIIGSPVYCESGVLNHSTTYAGFMEAVESTP
uniref:Uncharacterized protein n=1 Tax=Timema bartmani TaxID=61472 RepID=A0A7R9F0P0_9NEOP|nr:unnamed protein product [Timema bartmani]